MKRLVAVALAGLAAACSAVVTSPSQSVINTPPAATLLPTRYQWACSGWGGVPPPVARSVFDILIPVLPDHSPDPKAFAAILAAGGRLLYALHSGFYRIELDVAALAQLGTGSNKSVVYARNVRSLDDFIVPFAGQYQPPASDADLVKLVSAGAFQLTVHTFSTSTIVSGFIDDSRWPQLTALPIKFLGLNVPLLCFD